MKSLLITFAAALTVFGLGAEAQAGPPDKDANEAYWWWGDPAGTARIVRTDKGISGNISVHLGNESGSAKGLAITLWLVIFNNPDECVVAGECGDDADFGNPDVMPDVVYGGGNVVGASEKARIGFHYKAGNNSGSIADLFVLPTDNGDSYGLIDPRGAEVHYVLRFHGPVDPAAMPAQIGSYDGGCIFDAPFGYLFPTGSDNLYLGLGDCQDVIFAVNIP